MMTTKVITVTCTRKMLLRGVINSALLLAVFLVNFSLFYASHYHAEKSSSGVDFIGPLEEVAEMKRLAADLAARGDLWKQSQFVSLCKSFTESETLESCSEAGFLFDEENCKCRYDTRFQPKNTYGLFDSLMDAGQGHDGSIAVLRPSDSGCSLKLAPITIPQPTKNSSFAKARIRHPAVVVGLACAWMSESFSGKCATKDTFTRTEYVELFESGGFHIESEEIDVTLPRTCQVVPYNECSQKCPGDSKKCVIQIVQDCPSYHRWNATSCKCDCLLSSQSCSGSTVFDAESCSCLARDSVESDCLKVATCPEGSKPQYMILLNGTRACICSDFSTTNQQQELQPTTRRTPNTSIKFINAILWRNLTTSTKQTTIISTPVTSPFAAKAVTQGFNRRTSPAKEKPLFLWPVVVGTTSPTWLLGSTSSTKKELALSTTSLIASSTPIFTSTTETSKATATADIPTIKLDFGAAVEISPSTLKVFSSPSPTTSSVSYSHSPTRIVTSKQTPKRSTTLITSTTEITPEQLHCSKTYQQDCEAGFRPIYDAESKKCVCSCLSLNIYPRWICRKLMYWRFS